MRRLSSVSLALLLSFATSAAAGTYYVAPSGHDSGPGTVGQPWRTLAKAAGAATAGDTVYIRAGTYNERLVPAHSGSAGAWITYVAYPGETPVIDGTGVTLPAGWGGLLEISGLSFVEIRGLRVQNAGPDDNHAGILVEDSSHVTIRDSSTYDTASSGIGVWSSDHVTVAGNTVELACNDGEQECITIAGTDVFEVRYNHVLNGGPGSIGGEGIDVKDGSSNGTVHHNHVEGINRLGIYVDAWDKHTWNVDVYSNRVHGCGDDGIVLVSEAGGLLENVRVYNNVVYDNRYVGLEIANWGAPVPSRPIDGVEILNNTLHGNGWGGWGGCILVDDPDATGVVIRNNVCSQNASFQVVVSPGVPMPVVDHNLIWSFVGEEPGEIRGSAVVEAAPSFVNAAAGDFHLTAGSPAIDQGSPIAAPALDYDGGPRPQGAATDLGAFEFGVVFGDGFESGDLLAWTVPP